MQHLRLHIATPAQPAFDVEHAAEVAEHDSIGAAGGNVFAFAFGDVRGDVAVLDGEGAAEAAALFTLIHLARNREKSL